MPSSNSNSSSTQTNRPVVHQWGRSLFSQQPQPINTPPVRILMADGEWKVPPAKRPKLAPPPVEHKRESPMTRIRGME